MIKRLRNSKLAISIFLTILSFVVLLTIRNYGKLEFIELVQYDYFASYRASHSTFKSPIVMIEMSESDFNYLKQWPISDEILAQMLEKLEALKPRVIGIDMFRDVPMPPGEEKLRKVFKENNNIVTVMRLGDHSTKGVNDYYVLENTELSGFSDTPYDPNGTIRRALLMVDDGQTVYYSFALLMAALYLQKDGIYPEPDETNPNSLRLGKTTFNPIDPNFGPYINSDTRGDQIMIDFKGKKFNSYTLQDVLFDRIKKEDIYDKLVITGITDITQKDYVFTTISRLDELNQIMPGVTAHAYIVNQLLRGAINGDKPIKSLNERYEWLLIYIASLIGGMIGLKSRSFLQSFFSIAIMIIILMTGSYAVYTKGVWLPIIPMGMSLFIAAALVTLYLSNEEKQERNELMLLFSKHISSPLAQTLWQQRESFMHKGRPLAQTVTATVLFTDIKGFTTVSEHFVTVEGTIKGAIKLMDWLNEYISEMAEAVEKNGGIVNKYIGDAVMAIFGVPVARTKYEEFQKDALNAVNCALDMEKRLNKLNEKWKDEGLPSIKMRSGIYTGSLVAGSLGSDRRMEYTVIGDTVNIASRLESYDKDLDDENIKNKNNRILVGDYTHELIKPFFLTKEIGSVKLKGKTKDIAIYLIINSKDNSNRG
ncbi:transmembrane sensor domain-containing protein [Candidatus Magnetoovum chiemensis]|nr:transmembrane sensor domain-containing protein [Candidatus Magnetoovum chiemensis]